MKAITWLATFTAVALTATASAYANTGWETDLDKAMEQAKVEKKSVLIDFTGSDWCPPCIVLNKSVFSKKEFINEASKKFVLVKIDFPKGNPALAEKNEPIAKKFNIDGFPTCVLLDHEGKEFTRFVSSQFLKVEDFLKHLDEALVNKELD